MHNTVTNDSGHPSSGLPASSPGAGLELPHLPALDGLRGLAILAVMIGHLSLMLDPGNWLDSKIIRLTSAGWCGVDLFFVLSGFLITNILRSTRYRPGYFKNFYARRVLRIFPLYYAMLCIYFVVIPRIRHLSFDLSKAPAAIYYWTYLVNFVFALKGDAVRPVFEFSWSLCIEEQFYLVWPFLIWLLSRKTMIRVCIAILVLEPVLRAILTAHGYSWRSIYMLTPCRLDGLAIGSLLALWRPPAQSVFHRRLAALLACSTAIFVVALPGFRNTRVGQVAIYSILALGCASLLFLLLQLPPHSRWKRLVENRPLFALGRYSYALYLFHGLLAKLFVDPVAQRLKLATLWGSRLPLQIVYWILAFGISIPAAMASWALIEKHLLGLKRYFKYGSS